MKKINYLLFIFLILLFKFCEIECTINYEFLSQSNQYLYPSSSENTQCETNVIYILVNTDEAPIGQIALEGQSSPPGLFTCERNYIFNDTSAVFSIKSTTINVGNLGIPFYFIKNGVTPFSFIGDIKFNCTLPNIESLTFIQSELKFVNSKFESLFHITGFGEIYTQVKNIKVKFGNDIPTTFTKLSQSSYYLLTIEYPDISKSIISDWVVSVYFQNNVKNITLTTNFVQGSAGLLNLNVSPKSSSKFAIYTNPSIKYFLSYQPVSAFYFLYAFSDNKLQPQPICSHGTISNSTCFMNFRNDILLFNSPKTQPIDTSYSLFIPNGNSYTLFSQASFKSNELLLIGSSDYDDFSFFNYNTFSIHFNSNYSSISNCPSILYLKVSDGLYITKEFEFPYGYSWGDYNNISYRISLPSTPFFSINFNFTLETINQFHSLNQPIFSKDIYPPKILNYNIEFLLGTTVGISLTTTDYYNSTELSTGIRMIYICKKVFSLESLISKENNTEKWFLVHDTLDCPFYSSDFSISVIDFAGNSKKIKFGDYIESSLTSNILFVYPLDISWSVFDEINVSFKYSNLNVTNQSFINKIIINIPKLNNFGNIIGIPFEIKYTDYRIEKGIASYNSNSKLFEGLFFVPANLKTGQVYYELKLPTSTIGVFYKSGINSNFNVTSNAFDSFGPTIKSIIKYPNESNLINSNSSTLIGFKILVEEQLNGIDDGYVIIRGSIDKSIYNFSLSISNAVIGGTPLLSEYELFIDLNNSCISQNYTISEIYLRDTQGWSTSFITTPSQPPQFQALHPFIQMNNWPEKMLEIQVLCQNKPIIYEKQSLIGFIIAPKIINIFGSPNERTVTYDFVIEDSNGIKKGQDVYIYVTTTELDVIRKKATLKMVLNTFHHFQCNFTFPWGFGGFNNNYSSSIYGFINNNGKFNGFSQKDIGASYTDYVSTGQTINFPINPIILSTSGVIGSDSNTTFNIIGRNLSKVKNIKAIYQQNEYYLPIISITNQKITTSNYASLPQMQLSLEYDNGAGINITSESINVVSELMLTPKQPYIPPIITPTPSPTQPPTQPPTNPPQKCLGNPECGGILQGSCKFGGCICILPWTGNDCSSKIIEVEPKVDENEPSSSIIIDNNNNNNNNNNNKTTSSYSGSIAIVSVREINSASNAIINEFQFKEWNKTLLSDDDISTKHSYSTSFKRNSSLLNPTNIITILEIFKKETPISFANQNFTMLKSSIKYTITLDSYDFSTKISNLQVIMSASIQSSQTDDICSKKEFGDSISDYSNYVKIQVDTYSLYGKFIKRGIIDSEIINIQNDLLDDSMNTISKSNSQQSFIGITIPMFTKTVLLDPDFSVLLDTRNNGDDENSICSKSKDSGLSKTQLIGIIIGSVVFGILIIIIGILFASRNSTNAKILVHKLKTFKKS
ncbi:hypothetical protein ACTFIR_007038 [Dictyostelium discoideum]